MKDYVRSTTTHLCIYLLINWQDGKKLIGEITSPSGLVQRRLSQSRLLLDRIVVPGANYKGDVQVAQKFDAR